MQKSNKHNFFTRNGKSLRCFTSNDFNLFRYQKENVSSIAFADVTRDSITALNVEPSFRNVFDYKINKFKKTLNKINFNVSLLKNFWVGMSYAAFSLTALILVLYPMKVTPQTNHKYSIYASTPLLLGSTDYQIYSKDARSQKINQVFRQFNCPLEGLGEVFVYEADKNNIPWWLVASISFQESSCGKMTPEPKGSESYNAWGWAVYGDQVQSFDNWARGIEQVSAYMGDKFFSKGITDTCDIMKTYTPPSKGSWCEGVKYFGDLIQNYKSPQQ